MRVSGFFVTAASAIILKKYAVIKYPWTRLNFTPYSTSIPPHVIFIDETKSMKLNISQHTKNISDGMRD